MKNCYQALFYGTFLGSVLSAFLCFGLSYRRLWNGLTDLFYSFLFYLKEFVNPESNDVIATVTQFPDIRLEEILPFSELIEPVKFISLQFNNYLLSIQCGARDWAKAEVQR